MSLKWYLQMYANDFIMHSTYIKKKADGAFGETINGGDVAAASDLYQDGVGCGACYQVRCTNTNYCLDKGVTIVITDHGSGHDTDFILNRRAFGRMAQTAVASPLAFGVVDVEYKRVSCNYSIKNITHAHLNHRPRLDPLLLGWVQRRQVFAPLKKFINCRLHTLEPPWEVHPDLRISKELGRSCSSG